MESGGEDATASPPSPNFAPPPPPEPPPAPPPPPEPAPAPPPPAASAAPATVDTGPPGHPIILCLGDATTQLGSHIMNFPTADVDSAKHKASLSVMTDPVASEFLRKTKTDVPGVEHGPGWVALLARDLSHQR